jgi:hypothetical protein
MLVSNLGPEVTDEDIQVCSIVDTPLPYQFLVSRATKMCFEFMASRQELFMEHGGPIKRAEVFYKQDGSSSGQAVRRCPAQTSFIFPLPPVPFSPHHTFVRDECSAHTAPD